MRFTISIRSLYIGWAVLMTNVYSTNPVVVYTFTSKTRAMEYFHKVLGHMEGTDKFNYFKLVEVKRSPVTQIVHEASYETKETLTENINAMLSL